MAKTPKSTVQASDREWVVTLTPETSAGAVGAALAEAGLNVEQVLGEIGVILGRGAPGLAPRLRRVVGVADVAEQAPIDIGPPDSAVS